MMPASFVGAVILGIPLFLVAWLALRRQPQAILLFALALIVVGLGYLMATGATDDIARRVVPAMVPVKA